MKQIRLAISFFLFFTLTGKAQFSVDSTQAFAVCNAGSAQQSVRAFSLEGSGYISTWIDKRNGSNGTGLYLQRLDTSGVPLLAANGLEIYSAVGKEIWGYDIAPWQNGFLIAWVQGGFGIGGDSLFCDYIDASGNHLWNQPINVSNKTASVIYISQIGLKVMPNDSGAFITYGLVISGGADFFSFNRIDFTGNLYWPVNNFVIALNGYVFVPEYDQHNGFYVATSGGGIGAPIKVQHYGLDGASTFPAEIDVTQGTGGRNISWSVLCDADTNAYVIWDDNTGDIRISKINPRGNLVWPSGFKTVCGYSGAQAYLSPLLYNNTIYVTWSDGRIPAANAFIYVQKMDTSGTALWTPDGVSVCRLNSYIPYAKLAAGRNGNIVNTYLAGGTFRAQCLAPDSTSLWQNNGIPVASAAVPFYDDYVLVSDTSGAVAAFWSDDNDIFAARISPDGILTKTNTLNPESFSIYPNPASGLLYIKCDHNYKQVNTRILSYTGQVVVPEQPVNNASTQFSVISLTGLASGIYMVEIAADGNKFVHRLVIE
ncbi:MAG TPA: T9SS type A sorting domain-containing protein [Bacteroidia bacterium]|nr:T9SS type A sorting domain-containing protein [Bacteroidia bacterium]